ncbi:MAG TPA: hypothetical protein VES70_08280 [Pseudomonas sp.]|nr:hypothetical protein [Pseudomonas sp.]
MRHHKRQLARAKKGKKAVNALWICSHITAIYVSSIFILMGYRFSELSEMALNELGDFFAGAFGPPAFLWLVVGQVQQRRDIARNAEAYERSLEPSLLLDHSRTTQTETGPADFFIVSNHGAYCRKLTARVSGHSLSKYHSHLGPLPTGAELEFGVGQHLPTDGFYKVTFSYEKQNGTTNEWVFAFIRNTIKGQYYFIVTDDLSLISDEQFGDIHPED